MASQLQFNSIAGAVAALGPEIDERVRRSAGAIAEEARRAAPVLTGAYRDSIHVEATGDGADVVAGVPYAAVIEYGSSTHPPHATLRNAVAATHDDVAGILNGED